MFDIASSEFILVALVALLVIGPKDLPRVLRYVGNWVGKARGVASQFRSGFDEMVRESELADLEKKWAAENRADHAAIIPQRNMIPNRRRRLWPNCLRQQTMRRLCNPRRKSEPLKRLAE